MNINIVLKKISKIFLNSSCFFIKSINIIIVRANDVAANICNFNKNKEYKHKELSNIFFKQLYKTNLMCKPNDPNKKTKQEK